jgi:hypothetical protein
MMLKKPAGGPPVSGFLMAEGLFFSSFSMTWVDAEQCPRKLSCNR